MEVGAPTGNVLLLTVDVRRGTGGGSHPSRQNNLEDFLLEREGDQMTPSSLTLAPGHPEAKDTAK